MNNSIITTEPMGGNGSALLDVPENTSTESHVTTKFVDGGDGAVVAPKKIQNTDSIESEINSIQGFLSRPVLMYTGEFLHSAVKNDQVFPSPLTVSPLMTTMWSEKVKGFNLFRGTVCVRVTLNAMPFHQGRLILHYLPATTAMNPALIAAHNFSLVEKYQHPHVEIDCRDSYCEMKIPFVRPDHYAEISPSYEDDDNLGFGTFWLDVVSPLEYGTSVTKCIYTAYVWWEDIELKAPIYPQSSGGGFKKARVSGKSPEADKMSGGPISSALKLTSKAASTLSAIPMLTSYMSPLSWAANIGSEVAASFGWSKPTNSLTATPVARMYHKHAPNYDGTKNSFKMALDSQNELKTIRMGLTDEDEMSFNFLKKVETYLMTETWSTSDPAHLFSLGISPINLHQDNGAKVYSSKTVYSVSAHPIFGLASQFQLWRGSVNIKIKFVKTQFHTGRLEVTWTPTTSTSASVPSVYASGFSMREVIDLASTDEVEFNLPWMSPWNYLPVDNYSGTLSVNTLTTLVAPDTVAQDVQMLIFYSYGDDFELEAPGETYQLAGFNMLPFVVNSRSLATSGGIAESQLRTTNLEAASESIGEKFTSIRQLMNRAFPLYRGPTIASGSYAYAFYPWSNPIMTVDGATGIISYGKFGYDMFSYFSSMYAYYRGGMNIDVCALPDTSSNYIPLMFNTQVTSVYDGTDLTTTIPLDYYYATPASTHNSPASAFAQCDGDSTVTGITFPYYARGKATLINPKFTSRVQTWAPNNTEPAVIGQVRSQPVVNAPFFFRSVADDFQFGYFIGTIPYYTRST